jgi:excisionase family DNA binding protein
MSTTALPAPLTMTVEQAGRLLGISRGAAYRAAARGQIPTIRLGRRLLVPTARLHQLLGITTTDDLEPDAPATAATAGREHHLHPGFVDRPATPTPRPATDHPRIRHRHLQTGRDPARRTRPTARRRIRHHHPAPNHPPRPHPDQPTCRCALTQCMPT